MKRRWLLAGLPLVLLVSAAWAGLITQSGARLFTSGSGSANTPFASQFSLEVLSPKPSGSIPTGIDSNSPALHAYTGLTYKWRAAAIGGCLPYTWSATGAEAGKYSIDADTGEITYTNPQAGDDTTNIQVTATDACSTAASQTYSITVGTSGWFFVDGTTDGSGDTGTAAAPFDTLAQAYSGMSAGSRLYIRAGTYTLTGITTTANTNPNLANGEERIEWNNGVRGTAWLAYPGDARPVIDFEYTGDGFPYDGASESKPRIRMTGSQIVLIGLEFRRSMTMAFQMSRVNRQGVYVWNNVFDTIGPGLNGGNSAFIMWISHSNPGSTDTSSYGDIVIGNHFENVISGSGNSGVKMYAMQKSCICDNDFVDSNGAGEIEYVAIKGTNQEFSVVGNRFSDITDIAIGGNMAGTQNADPDDGNNFPGETTTGDILYNYVADATEAALDIGVTKIREIGRIDVKRNTFVGKIRVYNVATEDGIYNFDKNAIENADGAGSPWPFIEDALITDSSRVDIGDELTGASGVVDGSGNLVDTSKVGQYGHVIP